MAQPVRVPSSRVHWGAHLAMMEHADLMAHVGMVTALHSEIEYWITMLFAYMLGTDRKLGLSIYAALRAEASQRDVLKVVASLKLPKELCEELPKFLVDFRDKGQHRNAVAHGLWGTSKCYPDALLHQEPKSHMLWVRNIGLDGRYIPDASAKSRDAGKIVIRAYFKKDFELIERELTLMLHRIGQIHVRAQRYSDEKREQSQG